MGTNGVPKKVAKSCPNSVQGVKGNLGNTKRKDVFFGKASLSCWEKGEGTHLHLGNLILPSHMSQVCVDHVAQFILVNIPEHSYLDNYANTEGFL